MWITQFRDAKFTGFNTYLTKDNMFRHRWISVPKRTSELVALMAVSSTLFLFLHTRELHLRLEQMQVKFQPEESFSSDEKNTIGTMMRQLKTSVDQKFAGAPLDDDDYYDNFDDFEDFDDDSLVIGDQKLENFSPLDDEESEDNNKSYHCSSFTWRDERAEEHLLEDVDPSTVNELSESMEPRPAETDPLTDLKAQRSDIFMMEELDINALNNTKKSPKEILFFNRVPKVGSQTFMEMLRRLSQRNKFDFHRDHIQRVETIRIGVREQFDLARMIDHFSPPSVYVKHICFVNFTTFKIPQPIYVNMVRDPVERVISWYYYVRAPWYYVERKQAFPDLPLPDPSWLKKDFETCVLQHDRECQYIENETREGIGDHRRQTMFFCGQSNDCLPFNSQAALERAKRAVEENYAVVGILEDMNTTLTVLENYVPRFFQGSSQIYQAEMEGFRKINRNAFKPIISEEIKNIIRQNFTREIEFYQFCRQRLHKQLFALKLPTMSDNTLK